MGSSRMTFPLSHSRFKCEYGSTALPRHLSSMPLPRSTFNEVAIL
jgi:hypothetical protein